MLTRWIYNIYIYAVYIHGVIMPLSIRNKDAERLAREVARETGESITQAILRSLEERLLRLSGRRIAGNLAEEVLRIGGRCAALVDLDTRSPDDILGYDHDGAPR
jgi:antitoxin VapB